MKINRMRLPRPKGGEMFDLSLRSPAFRFLLVFAAGMIFVAVCNGVLP
jgi:hypothetical protein